MSTQLEKPNRFGKIYTNNRENASKRCSKKLFLAENRQYLTYIFKHSEIFAQIDIKADSALLIK